MPGAVLALKEWDGYPLDEDCLNCACGAVYGGRGLPPLS